jgi:hypothetical protein
MSFRMRKGRASFSVSKRGPRAGYRMGCLLPVLLVIAACGGVAATVAPTREPTPEPVTGYTDAEKEALTRKGIELVYGTDPQPDWYPDLHIVDGQIDLAVDGTSLFVAATSAALADQMCREIAAVAYDDNAEPIGWRHVHIQVGPDIVADCDTRE